MWGWVQVYGFLNKKVGGRKNFHLESMTDYLQYITLNNNQSYHKLNFILTKLFRILRAPNRVRFGIIAGMTKTVTQRSPYYITRFLELLLHFTRLRFLSTSFREKMQAWIESKITRNAVLFATHVVIS